MPQEIRAIQNVTTEWSFSSGIDYDDPFNQIMLDVHICDEHGKEWIIPCYWAGENEWRVRFSPPDPGTYKYHTISNHEDSDLHDISGLIEATEYRGSNELLKHGPLRVSPDRRHFKHADGSPFFWLADTWWMGLCKRLSWPAEFQLLGKDRIKHGYTVIQIVAGLYPDMPAFDERGANEAGFPWEDDYSRINPAYFDMADLRIQWLTSSGLAPCIVGCWGYFLNWMGIERMKLHWRNLIARWGSYPVTWCLAGEASMPYYLSSDKEADSVALKEGWTELARYVQEIDPYNRPVTIHPTNIGRDQILEPELLDFDMLQTGHGDRGCAPKHVQSTTKSLSMSPKMPVLVGEVCYEGILEACRSEMQRFLFWSAMLSGAAGHTYGANGIWQLNEPDRPFGPSPHGGNWGVTPWQEAYLLPGSRHVAMGKRILERYQWWNFESHPEWVEPHWSEDDYFQPYCAGIPGKVRMIYSPSHRKFKVKSLDPEGDYSATYINPKTGKPSPLGSVQPHEDGSWEAPDPPIYQDWVLVLEIID